jgi:hypothetical protein
MDTKHPTIDGLPEQLSFNWGERVKTGVQNRGQIPT